MGRGVLSSSSASSLEGFSAGMRRSRSLPGSLPPPIPSLKSSELNLETRTRFASQGGSSKKCLLGSAGSLFSLDHVPCRLGPFLNDARFLVSVPGRAHLFEDLEGFDEASLPVIGDAEVEVAVCDQGLIVQGCGEGLRVEGRVFRGHGDCGGGRRCGSGGGGGRLGIGIWWLCGSWGYSQ